MWIARHGILQSAGNKLLLDFYPNAAAAYGLRKLRTNYGGFAFRVRRSSDSTQTDIGFTSTGNIDEASLLSFTGSGSGYITIWYDQSGNGRNMTENTFSPTIVFNGTIFKINNKATITFDGTTNRLTASSYTLSTSSIFSVARAIGTTSNNYQSIFGRGSLAAPASRDIYLYFNTNTGVNQIELQRSNGSSYPTSVVSGLSLNNTFLASGIYNGSSLIVYRNGVAGSTVNTTIAGSQSNSETTIGSVLEGTGVYNNRFNGYISEVIVYTSDQSSNRTGIESNINSYFSIY